jgi:integrase
MGVQLNADAVRDLAIDGRDRIVFDTEPGFGIRVTPAGSKIFIAQARVAGRMRRVSVGTFPETSVKDARTAARLALQAMRDGKDPADERAKAASRQVTVGEFADRWLAERVRPHLKGPTVRDYQAIVDQFVKPRFGNRQLGALTRSDIIALHTEMANRPRRANYIVQTISAMMSYAEEVEVRPHGSNPARKIKKYREMPRERIMEASEQALAFRAIEECHRSAKLSVWACQGLRFTLLTGARPDEVRNVQWEYLLHDLKRVVLPDSKANRTRVIYCNELAWQVLVQTPRFGKFVFAGAQKDTAYRNYTRAWEKVRTIAGLQSVRLYDARHTFASEAAKAGHSLPMIGQLLGHSAPRTTQRYVHLVGDPVAAAAQDVGSRMDLAFRGGPQAEVVKLPTKRLAAT